MMLTSACAAPLAHRPPPATAPDTRQVVDAPSLPEAEASYAITAAGIDEYKD